MKKTIVSVLALCISCVASFAGTIVIQGKYQNKNLYVQNGFAGSGVGFCTYEVLINGQVTTDEINSSAFEIDFSQFQIKPGTEVKVEIKHKDDCTPKVLNPEALKPKATFEPLSINVNDQGTISWSVKNEQGSLPFIIEQYRWNKWINVGEIMGEGSPEKHDYKFQVSPHSGINRFRVKQIGFGGTIKYTKEITLNSAATPLTFAASKDAKQVMLSGESMYEVYDAYGNIVKKGYGKDIDVASFNKGLYYLCFDNQVVDFRKK
ncbi:MAG TPA: hypothetical protein VGO45_03095 [Bacteroidia bacterium]|jgi:hypothetical protein|nr:hypothetical protein [Bacteroidia bacterium]